jgi:hypothetical protein
MRTSQILRRSLQATLALVALSVTTLLAHAFATEAVLPSDPRELLVTERVDEAI